MSESVLPAWSHVTDRAGAAGGHTWLDTVRRRWWIATVIVVAALVTALILTSQQKALYRSSTTIAIAPAASISDLNEVVRSLDTLERRTIIATVARIAGTTDFRDQAAVAARVPVADARGAEISATVLPNTNLLRITVEGDDPQRVATLANAAAATLAETTAKMYRVYQLTVISRATPASQPFFPNPGRNYTVALVSGLVAAAGALFLLHWINTRQALRGAGKRP